MRNRVCVASLLAGVIVAQMASSGCERSAATGNVVSVDADGRDMKAAVATARRRWPEFVAAWKARKPGQPFAIKAPFKGGPDTEHMWVEVTDLTAGTIKGTLANDPVRVKRLRNGDKVIVAVSDVEDWYFPGKQGEMVGGFTSEVLERRQRGEQPAEPARRPSRGK